MIIYEPLWKTMKAKSITQYMLIKKYGFSTGTLDSLRKGKSVSTNTINQLCHILNCKIEDIAKYIPDNSEE